MWRRSTTILPRATPRWPTRPTGRTRHRAVEPGRCFVRRGVEMRAVGLAAPLGGRRHQDPRARLQGVRRSVVDLLGARNRCPSDVPDHVGPDPRRGARPDEAPARRWRCQGTRPSADGTGSARRDLTRSRRSRAGRRRDAHGPRQWASISTERSSRSGVGTHERVRG